MDAEKQVVEEVEKSLLELGRMTVRVRSDMVMIDGAEVASGSAEEAAAAKPKEMIPPPKKPATKKAPFPPPGRKPAIKKEKEKKEETIRLPEQKKMPKAPAPEEKKD